MDLECRGKTRFVIDAPTLLYRVAEDVPVADGHQLVAPNLLRSQALALLFDDVRAGRLTEREALARHEASTQLKVRLLGDRVSRRVAWQIARERGLDSTVDADYLAVTRLQADVPWTGCPSDPHRRTGGVRLGKPVGAVDFPADRPGRYRSD